MLSVIKDLGASGYYQYSAAKQYSSHEKTLLDYLRSM
jgi:hypothetical protein